MVKFSVYGRYADSTVGFDVIHTDPYKHVKLKVIEWNIKLK